MEEIAIAVGISWIVLFIVWLPGYFVHRIVINVPHPLLQVFVRILLGVGFLLIVLSTHPRFHRFGAFHIPITPHTLALGIIGLIIDYAGIIFAIWARFTLGKNWSSNVVLQREQQLVQTGPYAITRHPIYTGIFFGLLGTAITWGYLTAYFGVICCLIALIIRVNMEDRLMSEQFGAVHGAYRRHTKKLIPGIW